MNCNNCIYNKEFNIKEQFIRDFESKLYKQKVNNNYSQVVFVCVGTDRVIGDCLGPLVGSKLIKLIENYNIFNINIYGTLEENINYMNIQNVIKRINKYHENACVVIVDAALSKSENIGKIFVSTTKTVLGKGINKNKIAIGDISIKAVVGKDFRIPKYNFRNLQDTSLGLVIKLSETVANGIFEVIKYT